MLIINAKYTDYLILLLTRATTRQAWHIKANIFSTLSGPTKYLFDQFEPPARKFGFVVRKSKGFSASGFVLSLVKSVITGKASFNQLAASLGLSEQKSISRQAVQKRIDLSTVPFLLLIVGVALKQR